MQVLVKNPYSPEIGSKGLIESFWSPNCLYPSETFSFSSLMGLTDPVGLSPFLMLDPVVAFTVSQAEKKISFCKNLGPLGTLGVHFFSGEKVIHEENPEAFMRYREEYLPHDPVATGSRYEQVIVFGENVIDEKLWSKLSPGGFYIIGTRGKITPGNYPIGPFGKLWPVGMPTEIGWQFDETNLGLDNFSFAKLKKL